MAENYGFLETPEFASNAYEKSSVFYMFFWKRDLFQEGNVS